MQAVLSTGVVVLAVMAERIFGFKVGLRQWAGVAMTAAGLMLLVVTLPRRQRRPLGATPLAGMISFEAGMLVIGALLISGPRLGAPDHHHGIMLGAAAGDAVRRLRRRHQGADRRSAGFAEIVFSPWLMIAAAASVVAFYASARGMQQGEAVPVIAATSTAANVSCILGGIVVFGDPMPVRHARHRPPGPRLHDGRRRGARHAAAGPRGGRERHLRRQRRRAPHPARPSDVPCR